MEWLLMVAGALVFLFGFVVMFGAPYLPTLGPQVDIALKLINLQKGDHLLELGCGDGKVLIAAAEKGLRVTGYELNPLLAIIAWARTRRYGKQVKVVWGNFWRVNLPEAGGIFTFLLPKYMNKLDNKITQEYSGKKIKLVSFAFSIPDKKIIDQKGGVYLYTYSS